MDLYDEFGNRIGEDTSSDSQQLYQTPKQVQNIDIVEEQDQIILNHQKQYYPDLQQIYPQAEILVMQEDAQPITQPIVTPIKQYKFQKLQPEVPLSSQQITFIQDLMKTDNIRNIAFIGHLHHGKTSLIDLLAQENYPHIASDGHQASRYTDNRNDQISREISIKSKPLTLVLQTSKHKHFLFNLMDTPGHPNFSDQVTAALRIVDGVFLVVDIVEGMLINTQKLLIHALQQNLPVILILNKIDRLVLELKMPPGDAYYKIKHTIDQINNIVQTYDSNLKFDPRKNVIFSSGLYGIGFTLKTFAQIYLNKFGYTFDPEDFALRLWGDQYFDTSTRQFSNTPKRKQVTMRSFVQFVLVPLYKLISYTVSQPPEVLSKFLKSIGMFLNKKHFKLDSKTLLKIVSKTFFGELRCIRDLAVNLIPSPLNSKKLQNIYTDSRNQLYRQFQQQKGPLLIQIAKQYPKENKLVLFGRVLSGIAKKGTSVDFLGPQYTPFNPEDSIRTVLKKVSIFNSRFWIQVSQIPAGNFICIQQESFPYSNFTIVQAGLSIFPLKPLQFNTVSVMKIALEPYNPSELPIMLQGLRKCSCTYPILEIKVQQSGEHQLVGTGELYLDSVLNDFRTVFTEIQVKLSEPFVAFTQTVTDMSSFKSFAQSSNKQNKIYMVAEPLQVSATIDIQQKKFKISDNLSAIFQQKYGWDQLASANIWAFGPAPQGPNVLINDILPFERDFSSLQQTKSSICQGFQWACRQGPLCQEPLRGVKFRMIQSKFALDSTHRAPGQLIPTSRRVCYSSILLASPRLMEPYYLSEIYTTNEAILAVQTLLQKRRGHIVQQTPIPGSSQYLLRASIPVMDSFGFQSDLRTYTSGMAFVLSLFDQWVVVPGDPLDRNIRLKPLDPSPAPFLARDFMVKTRRRKGLAEDLTVAKYFDDPELLEIAKADQDLKEYLV